MANTRHVIDALAKLRWSAEGSWSASLKPEECAAILAILPEDSIVIRSLGAKDERPKPEILSGDPGDEHGT